MYFTHYFTSSICLLASISNAVPVEVGLQARQVTSPSIIQSIVFEVEDVVEAREKTRSRVDSIFEQAKASEEEPTDTAGKIQSEIDQLIATFTEASWAVDGDVKDAIPLIGNKEAHLLKTATDKLVGMARSMAHHANEINENQDHAILDCLEGDGKAIAISLRSIFTPIQKFVDTSDEDVDSPGALERARDDTYEAADAIDAVVRKLSD